MSKTDPDACFMRMKEDHMKNVQLKPAYNLQLSTQDQFILNYSIHQNSADTITLPAHLDGYKELYDRLPTMSSYQAQNCHGCPIRGVCHSQEGNRIIEVNLRLRKYRKNAREKLLSEAGIAYRKKRSVDVESIFGAIKHNKNFKRFKID